MTPEQSKSTLQSVGNQPERLYTAREVREIVRIHQNAADARAGVAWRERRILTDMLIAQERSDRCG